jgi:hypothetical protein
MEMRNMKKNFHSSENYMMLSMLVIMINATELIFSKDLLTFDSIPIISQLLVVEN